MISCKKVYNVQAMLRSAWPHLAWYCTPGLSPARRHVGLRLEEL